VAAEVEHLAHDVLAELKKRAQSPKLREEVERLADIAEVARGLQRKLAALDDITRALLLGELRDLQRPRRLVGPTPPPVPSSALAADLGSWAPGPAVHPLEALARAAERTRGFVFQRAAGRSGGLKRGAENLRDYVVGDVRVHLVSECARLMGAFQGPAAIAATEHGKLHDLAAAVWRYATGLGVEDAGGGGLANVVKRVAPVVRTVAEASAAFADAGPAEKDAALRELLRVETEAHARLRRPPTRARRARQGQGGIPPGNGETPS
jgi:hypothetical protein